MSEPNSPRVAPGPPGWRRAAVSWTVGLPLFWLLLAGSGFRVPGLLAAAEAAHAGPSLVLFSVPRVSFGLGHELELLLLQLRRLETPVETEALSNATPDRIEAAGLVVVFCPQPGAAIPVPTLHALRSTTRPVLWVGYLPSLPDGEPPIGHFRARPEAAGPIHRVRYRGREIDLGGAYASPVALIPGTAASPVVEVHDTAGTGAVVGAAPAGPALSLCWREGTATFFSAVPGGGPIGFLFSDLLLDLVPGARVDPSRVLLCIDDYQAGSDHAEFRRGPSWCRWFLPGIRRRWREPLEWWRRSTRRRSFWRGSGMRKRAGDGCCWEDACGRWENGWSFGTGSWTGRFPSGLRRCVVSLRRRLG